MSNAHPIATNVAAVVGTVGSFTLAQWSVLAGIVVAVLTIIYTGLNIYVLWRDKIIKYRKPGTRTRATDHGELDA